MAERFWRLPFGANPNPGGVEFRVWAPGRQRVDVVLYGPGVEQLHPLAPDEEGFFAARVAGAAPGARYRYRLDGGDAFPDPLSRSQPDGVHGPSEVVDPDAFRWSTREWQGIPLAEAIIYELHVGAFTEEGTFDAAAQRLEELRELGVTALQLMPVADFPGERNWGYDGAYLFAPARAYGGAHGLKRLVDAAHALDLAVLLDVVYNHLGPEGSYLPAFTGGRIFSEAHHTPWGAAINYDCEECGPVRELVVQNALYWLHEYRLDGLRLDATHAIIDDSSTHILQELTTRVRASLPAERRVLLIAEDERNERRLITPVEEGGLGLDAVWADDFHHQLRRLVAGDREGYFRNYGGTAPELEETLRKGWFYEGQHYASHDAPRGTPAADLAPPRFVHALQNHDQVGNRALGERLHHQVEPGAYRAASAFLALTPYTPLLFMGQEWAASTPFLFFTDHPEELGRLVTAGRREEFKHFSAFADPARRGRIPDPQSPETFRRSVLRWAERERSPHREVSELYRDLLALRRAEPALRERGREHWRVAAVGSGALALRRGRGDAAILLVASLCGELRLALPEREESRAPAGADWRVVLATEEERFGGSGAWGVLERDGTLRIERSGAIVLRASRLG